MSKELIASYRGAPIKIKEKEILRFCMGKSVMDVGCVGQDKFFQSPDWLHKKIKAVASKTLGVDVNMAWKADFEANGYALISVNELNTLTEKFDLVVMGDVIEHVSDVASFLNTYSSFLKPGGRMVITTPNPFSIRQFFTIFLYGHPSVNPEHTAWLDPLTMAEVFNRNGYKTEYFCWLHEYSKPTNFRNKILYPLYKLHYAIRKFYSPNFLFLISK